MNTEFDFVGKISPDLNFPKYVGEMFLTDNFSVQLTKYPNLFHRTMIRFFLGWKFRKYGDN